MLKDLQFALRSIRHNKLLATINVIGLSIGITAFLLIFLIAEFEMSFDRFQPDKERIYRIYSTFSGPFEGINRGIPTGIPVAIRENFTGIESLTNFHTYGGRVQVPDRGALKQDLGNYRKIIIADSGYFQVFSHYEWLIGRPSVMNDPFKVVLTESRAKIYFGDVDIRSIPGREVVYSDSLILTVGGIVRDIEARTDFDFTDFISFGTIERSWLKDNIPLNDWTSTNSASQLFVKLAPGTPIQKIEDQMPGLAESYREHTKESDFNNTPKFQPLSDLHFNAEVGTFDNGRSSVEKSTLHILMVVAALLLVIASINFINLETAQASKRSKEVGVRKVLGSSRARLIRHFLMASFILCIIAVVIAAGLALLTVKYFGEFMPEGFVIDFTDPVVVSFLVSCIILVTVLAGLYPAFVLSSFPPALALKNLTNRSTTGSRSSFVREVLTVFQFSFSQILIIGTIAVVIQLDFMLNKDLGFSTDGVIFVRTPWWEKKEKREVFRNELERIPEIEAISMHGAPPTSNSSSSSVMEYDNGRDKTQINIYLKQGDTDYIRLYDIKLLAGSNFQVKDTANVLLINETLLKELGFSSPHDALGKTLNNEYIITGVVRDFHTKSLHNEIEPTAIFYSRSASGFGIKLLTPGGKISDLKPGLAKIESAWKKVYPDETFEYAFMNDTIRNFYETEQRTSKLAWTATGIALLISCLGLFALSTFTVIQRTKEIGIRKVLGATVNNILFLLSRDFLKLVLIAFIIAAPVAFYLSNWWLKDFAYRMPPGAWIFLACGLASVVIAFATISYRTVSAAKQDPVKSLRYE